MNLKNFYLEAHLKGFGSFFSDPVMVETEIDTIRTMGFNALDTQYSGLAGVYRTIAEKFNITQTHHTFRIGHLPKDPVSKNVIADWDKIQKECSSYIERTIENLKREDPDQIKIIKFIDIGDEIAGEVFGGIEYEQGYIDYLKTQGLKPSDLRVKSWNDVKIYGSWNWRESWKMRPTDRTSVDSCINYYWTLRYWNHATAKVYSILKDEIKKRLPSVKVRVNFGPPWAYGYCSYMRGAEIWEFARQNSVDDFWNEDWLNTSGWRNAGIQMVSYLVDLSKSCAKINNADVSAFVMPVGGEDNIQLKLASVIGKGAKRLMFTVMVLRMLHQTIGLRAKICQQALRNSQENLKKQKIYYFLENHVIQRLRLYGLQVNLSGVQMMQVCGTIILFILLSSISRFLLILLMSSWSKMEHLGTIR